MPVETQSSADTNRSPMDRKAVAQQLERILSSPLFKQSKRYSPFLRYVVEKTLAGEADRLKERTLGIEVFGRAPNYDSSNDPVVRVTAGEVRKRIAQYYHDSEHEGELRIELSPGSYVPEFLLGEEARTAAQFVTPRTDAIQPGPIPNTAEPPKAPARGSSWLRWIGLGVVCAVVVAAVAWRLQTPQPGVVDLWWQPAFHSTSPVLFSVGTIEPGADLNPTLVQQLRPPSATDTVAADLVRNDHIGLVDAIALETFAAMFSAHKHSFRTLSSFRTTYDDLRGGPVVLLAGLDNPWTIRVTEPLRFHFALQDGSKIAYIADQQQPSKRDWQVDFSSPYSQLTKDFAIIARLHDATSDKPIFVVAGIGRNGTAAAVEYVTTESTLKALIGQLPQHWEDKNVEAVVQTRVINGQAGPPVLAGIQIW